METGRIFCIGRNYAKHIEELGNSPDSACLVFMKPASCIAAAGQTLSLPRDRGTIHHEAELVIRLSGGGRNIDETEALRHVDAYTLGLDLTLRDLQNQLKERSAPWELAKAFDQSAPLGNWCLYDPLIDLADLRFECRVNGQLRQQGHTADLLFPIPKLIQILSRTWALLPGDLIYTGTPAGVGPLESGDQIELSGQGLGPFLWPIE